MRPGRSAAARLPNSAPKSSASTWPKAEPRVAHAAIAQDYVLRYRLVGHCMRIESQTSSMVSITTSEAPAFIPAMSILLGHAFSRT